MDGILIIDKPDGITSHDVVARVRRILKIKRIGHTGTLDPFATGVLVVLVGQATRLAQFLSGAEKEYEALIRLGFATTTGDITGSSKFQVPSSKSKLFPDLQHGTRLELIEDALAALTGEIEQVPPMYSAKKVKGEKLYELARRGIEIERKPVRVTVKKFEMLQRNGEPLSSFNQTHQITQDDKTFDLPVCVICSAGTYIRTLAERVGEILGTGAHLAALRRTRAGEMKIEDALDLDELQNLAEANAVASKLISMDAALSEMPFVHLTDEAARRVRHGAAVKVDDENLTNGVKLRLRGEHGELIAIGEYAREERQVQPRVLLVG
ncbi:MAG: tRNA pseudouridine(55) synthase TruB [Pyrinomonadaceae bacterium]